ncbi:MAG: COX15/CtaA family protein, partial [Pseudomonadota bacterium]
MLSNSKPSKFFRMALWAATLVFVLVVFNAYARLSEAGFGCTDWPGCYGMLFAPITAQEFDPLRSAEEQ